MTRATWTRTKVEIETRGIEEGRTFQSVEGMVTQGVPGLAITDGTCTFDGYFVITHTASGYKLPWEWEEIADAMDALLAIGPIGDWTRDAKAILADTAFRTAVKAAVSSVPFSNTGSGQ